MWVANTHVIILSGILVVAVLSRAGNKHRRGIERKFIWQCVTPNATCNPGAPCGAQVDEVFT